MMKKLIVLLTAAALVFCSAVTAFGAGTVTYDGTAQKFIFEPGSEHSPTDLFSDLKGVMPGDTITQEIRIKNDVRNNVKIKLYMKSGGAQEGSEDFLSKLDLTVTQDGDSNLFAAPADQTAQLTDWVCLGTFYSGAEIDLNVTLQVPIELDNAYQDAVGYLDWQFKVEELPVEDDDPKPPKTGNASHLLLYVLLVCSSLFGIILLLKTRQKKQEQ